MGYYTDYTIEFDSALDEEKLAQKLTEVTGYYWDTDFEEYGIKWYDHKEHMHTISKLYPNVLFTLNGEGEESGDIWKAYFKNGKMQYEKSQIVFAPFDESKLK